MRSCVAAITAVLLAVIAAAAAAAAPASTAADVIVVGAGMSGLTAAADLQAAGYSVIVVEARDRVGGRLYSVDFKSVQGKIDLGGAWIHGLQGNPITKLADDNKIQYIKTSTEDGTQYWENGTELTAAQSTEIEDLKDEFDAYSEKRNDAFGAPSEGVNSTLADYVASFTTAKSLTPLQQQLLGAGVESSVVQEYAANTANLSARYYDENGAFEGQDAVFPGGYGQVVDTIAKQVSDIRLSYQVTRVAYNGTGVQVEVQTPTGTANLTARAAVITLPLGVLKKKAAAMFTPPLPADKQRAIQALGMGLLNKVILVYERKFWDNTAWISRIPTTSSSSGRFTEMFSLARYIPGLPALVVFNGGNAAWAAESATDQELTDQVTAALRKLYPDAPQQPKEVLITRWGKDPFSLGSYSFMAVGSTPADTAALTAPVNSTLFWAGEATSSTYPSAVHGAYLSGKAVADAVKEVVKAGAVAAGPGAPPGARNSTLQVTPAATLLQQLVLWCCVCMSLWWLA